jgi:formylglycine-generating enzyme required for sulfatase activity
LKKNKTALFSTITFSLILIYALIFAYQKFTFKNVEIISNAVGADVIINKKLAGTTPYILSLPRGTYTIGLSKKGYVVKYKTIEVEDTFKSYSISMVEGFRYIKRGSYIFNDKPMSIKGFYLAEAEVSNKEYLEFCNETGQELPFYWDRPQLMGDDQPALGVTYEDAVLFTRWYSKRTGLKCRLPYEFEWEYAANKGDLASIYPWGSEEKAGFQYMGNYHPYDFSMDQLLPINSDGFQFTAPSKSFPAGNNHLYDMGGNVFEFMLDSNINIERYPDLNLVKTPNNLIRIVKGGSWNFNQKLMVVKSRLFVDGSNPRGNNGIRLLIEKPVSQNN